MIKEKKNFKNFVKLSNEKIKNVHQFLQKKKLEYENKLKEYKNKIILLKQKINELYYVNNGKLNRNNSGSIYDNKYIITEKSKNNENNFNIAYNSSSQFYPRTIINKIDNNNNIMNNSYKVFHLKEKSKQ